VGCCGRCSCVIDGSPCVEFTGTGRASDPFVASLVIPTGAVVPHPLAPGGLPDTLNGPTCDDPLGLLAPQPGFPSTASGELPFGSNPDIVADTAGVIPWGPVLTVAMTNPNTDRLLLAETFTQFPFTSMVLEPGATGRVGVIFDPLGLAIFLPLWTVSNNSGAASETYGVYPQTFVGPGFVLPAAIDSTDIQMSVELVGSSGGSSITTIGGAGVKLDKIGVPL
jgi:hypothetical protein